MKLFVAEFLVVGLLLSLVLATGVAAEDVPPKPMQLEARTDFEGAVAIAVLSWREDGDNELGFEILRSDNNGDFRAVGMVGANTTNYRDEIGKYTTGAFTYKVRGFNDSGKGEASNTASVWF